MILPLKNDDFWQSEATAEEQTIVLSGAEIAELPLWAAESDGGGGMMYHNCETGLATPNLDVSYEQVSHSTVECDSFIEVMYEADDWRTAFVRAVSDTGTLVYFQAMQEWSLLEPSVFKHNARRQVAEGEPVAQRPPWMPNLPYAGVTKPQTTTVAGSLPKPLRDKMPSKSQEDMYQLWEAIRYAADASGRELARWFVKLPPLDAFPDYAERVARSVYLTQVRRKIVSGDYGSLDSFEADVTMMFENARKFYPDGSLVAADAVALQSLFWVSKSDEFCIKNEEFCVKNEQFCRRRTMMSCVMACTAR